MNQVVLETISERKKVAIAGTSMLNGLQGKCLFKNHCCKGESFPG